MKMSKELADLIMKLDKKRLYKKNDFNGIIKKLI